jgi:ubiquitin C-terminal hydrolase
LGLAVLGWQNTCETVEDIAATLAALNTEIDISIMYRGVDPKNTYSLVSVVCYYGQHYHCFAYSHEHDQWIMYDDQNVKVIGSWSDVLSMCKRGHLQPQVLLYEKKL